MISNEGIPFVAVLKIICKVVHGPSSADIHLLSSWFVIKGFPLKLSGIGGMHTWGGLYTGMAKARFAHRDLNSAFPRTVFASWLKTIFQHVLWIGNVVEYLRSRSPLSSYRNPANALISLKRTPCTCFESNFAYWGLAASLLWYHTVGDQ